MIHYNKKLYGITKTGVIKTWEVTVTDLSGSAEISIVHGQESGKKQMDTKIVSAGKNIGKKNETSYIDQAIFDAKSLANKKIDSGYAESAKDAASNVNKLILPMLAQKYSEHKKKITFSAVMSNKLDGFRCTARLENGEIILRTRKSKKIAVKMNNICKELKTILKSEGDMVDGELYYHGWPFQRIASAIKKKSDDTDLIQYIIYDVPKENDDSYKVRFLDIIPKFSSLDDQNAPVSDGCKNVFYCPQVLVNSEKEVEEQAKISLKNGFEGSMIRNINSKYLFKDRSYDLQKIKEFDDDEFEIVGYKDGTGREEGAIIFLCKATDDKVFDVRPVGEIEERRKMWNDKDSYIGKMLTVKYQGFTDDGLPRFGVGLRIREEE